MTTMRLTGYADKFGVHPGDTIQFYVNCDGPSEYKVEIVQMINGDTNRGILILALYLVSALAIIVLIGIPFAIGIWIWGMIDAYQGAQAWNRAHGILS